MYQRTWIIIICSCTNYNYLHSEAISLVSFLWWSLNCLYQVVKDWYGDGLPVVIIMRVSVLERCLDVFASVPGYWSPPNLCTPVQNILGYLAPNILRIYGAPIFPHQRILRTHAPGTKINWSKERSANSGASSKLLILTRSRAYMTASQVLKYIYTQDQAIIISEKDHHHTEEPKLRGRNIEQRTTTERSSKTTAVLSTTIDNSELHQHIEQRRSSTTLPTERSSKDSNKNVIQQQKVPRRQ